MKNTLLVNSSFWKQCFRGDHVTKWEETQVPTQSIKTEAGKNCGQSASKGCQNIQREENRAI